MDPSAQMLGYVMATAIIAFCGALTAVLVVVV